MGQAVCNSWCSCTKKPTPQLTNYCSFARSKYSIKNRGLAVFPSSKSKNIQKLLQQIHRDWDAHSGTNAFWLTIVWFRWFCRKHWASQIVDHKNCKHGVNPCEIWNMMKYVNPPFFNRTCIIFWVIFYGHLMVIFMSYPHDILMVSQASNLGLPSCTAPEACWNCSGYLGPRDSNIAGKSPNCIN